MAPTDHLSRSTMKRNNGLTTQISSKLVGRVIYPLWSLRDHPKYRRYSKAFERNQWLPGVDLRHLQLGLLQKQLIHAYNHIEFYRRRMEAENITPLDFRSLDDLRFLPVLTKREIQDNFAQLLASNVPEELRSINRTGGSTGSPLQFWVDKERYASRRASTDRHDAWAGLRPGDWCAVLWGSVYDIGTLSIPPITWKQRLLYRTLMLNTSVVSKADLDNYISLLRRYRPRKLKAYAQSAAMFARYCQETGADDIRFDSIITSAEVLLPENRVLIEETFGGKVFNRYGCREVSMIASECEHHTGLHINADALIVEIDPIPGGPPNSGRVLVTDLYNRSMPLIRYEIGDVARWENHGPCPCGRNLPRLASVEGRITDFLRLPDGKMVSGPSLTLVVAQMPEVRQAQFIQPSRTEIRLDVIPGNGFGSHTVEELKRRLHPYLGDEARFTVRPVESIASEVSGKYRFVKKEYEEPDACPVLV
jgi:phenylacetate-CoA ligase